MLYDRPRFKPHQLVLTCMAVLAATQARAAPQVLALIATDRLVALTCDGDRCIAELPTVCLQPARRMPHAGRAYRLAEGQSVALVGRSSAGKIISTPITREIEFAAARTHVAVIVEIPRDVVGLRGLVDPAIRVGNGVSLIPVATAKDDRPQTPDEIRTAIRDRRALATGLIDRDGERMPAVRLINRLVNRLPENNPSDVATVGRIWQEILRSSDLRNISQSAVDRAQFNVDLCASQPRDGISRSLRGCLEGVNDDAMQYLSNELEPVLKTGS